MSTTTLDLIARVKVRASMPSNDNYFSNATYLQFFFDEYLSQVVPLLQKVNEEYFLTHTEIEIVAGQTQYRIPAKAVSSGLRDVQLVDQAGNIKSLNRLYEEDRADNIEGYYIVGNKLELSKNLVQNTTYSIRLPYFRRPSQFVLPSDCAEITNINSNVITVASLPSNFSTARTVDFIQSSSPYDFVSEDQTISNIAGLDLTFSSVPSDLSVGDYICLSNQTCVPCMLPSELENVLVQSVLCTVLSSKKDKSVDLELQKLEMLKQSYINMLEPRIKSADTIITSRNSLLNHFRR